LVLTLGFCGLAISLLRDNVELYWYRIIPLGQTASQAIFWALIIGYGVVALISAGNLLMWLFPRRIRFEPDHVVLPVGMFGGTMAVENERFRAVGFSRQQPSKIVVGIDMGALELSADYLAKRDVPVVMDLIKSRCC
jgi:hypothetical protein